MTVINEHSVFCLYTASAKRLEQNYPYLCCPNLGPIATLFPSSGIKTVKLDSESKVTLDYLN